MCVMLFQVLFLIRRAISSLARTFEQGHREGGTRGTHVTSEIVTLKKKFYLSSMEFVTVTQIFSILLGFLGALSLTPPGALSLYVSK